MVGAEILLRSEAATYKENSAYVPVHVFQLLFLSALPIVMRLTHTICVYMHTHTHTNVSVYVDHDDILVKWPSLSLCFSIYLLHFSSLTGSQSLSLFSFHE